MDIVQNPALCKAVNRLNLELLTFGHATVDPQWYGNVVSPLFTRLYYITDGSFTIKNRESGKMELSSGNWYLIPSGYSFDYECEKSMTHFFFHLKLSDFDGTDLLRYCHGPLCLEASNDVDMDFLTHCTQSSDPADGLRLRQIAHNVLLTFINRFQISIHTEDYSPCICNAMCHLLSNSISHFLFCVKFR